MLSTLMSRPLCLSAAEYSILTALLEESVGLTYALADKPIFESKLAARMAEANFESALDYYYYLRYDDPAGVELNELVQALVVHETFFFRELAPLRTTVERFLKPLVEAGRRVRVWCAACSTGEEPLTLAMLLASGHLLDKVEIVASDVSGRALQRARSGMFGPRALRQALPSWAEPYLTRSDNGFVAAPELVRKIDWRRVNLTDAAQVQSVGELDLVICRNVLIYFADHTARKVVESLSARLRAQGTLLVGVSESLLRLDTSLVCEEHGGVFVYRKLVTP
jgi:chemotaxis protein methyltransferase CheR